MTEAARRVSVLAILLGAEQETLREILDASECYDLTCVRSPGFVRAAMLSKRPSLIITLDRFESGKTWKDVLAEAARSESNPQLLVCSRIADDRLWAEVLNHGAFDLLELPFRRNDLLYTINFAVRTHAEEPALRKLAAAVGECRATCDESADQPVGLGLKLA